jgi:uncharacterized cupredoxin-like copper-binding protein
MTKFLRLAILAAVAWILAACGGTRSPSTSIDVTFTEFAFNPKEFIVPAGQEISIHTLNNGAVVHEFVIMKLGTTVGQDFDAEDEGNIYWEIETPVGQESEATFTAPAEPGDYQIVCGTPGHYIAGMVGTLHVVAP